MMYFCGDQRSYSPLQNLRILKIHYSVLTLKLLVEKDEHALHHIALGVAKQEEIFLKAAFEFMLSGKHRFC